MKGSNLIFPMNRPQYVSVSEGFISALVWNLHEPPQKQDGKKIALRYSFEIANQSGGLLYRRTEPVGKDKLGNLARSLDDLGLHADDQGLSLAVAATKSVMGVRSEKGKFQPASPMSPSLALMQNIEGIQGSANPPALADIIETIYSLGLIQDESEIASTVWLKAANHRLGVDPLLSMIDSAMAQTALGGLPALKTQIPSYGGNEVSAWRPYLRGTPFEWFADTWKKINSVEWVEALPARVWSDWATTILRTSYGLAILWECAWYESLARCVIGSEPFTFDDVLESMDPPLPWRNSSETAEIRDLASKIKVRCQRAFEIRKTLEVFLAEGSNKDADLSLLFYKMQENEWLVAELKNNLLPKDDPNIGKALREAVRYALQIREEHGLNSDYYGLLRKSGTRYLFPEPAMEWISVMASMSCKTPGGKCSLGNVKDFLRLAGLEPNTRDLISLLERSGLARGSADADEGVKVEAAY